MVLNPLLHSNIEIPCCGGNPYEGSMVGLSRPLNNGPIICGVPEKKRQEDPSHKILSFYLQLIANCFFPYTICSTWLLKGKMLHLTSRKMVAYFHTGAN